MQDVLLEIRKLVSENKFQSALRMLFEKYPNAELIADALHLKSRIESLTQKKIQGVLTVQEEEIFQNKIRVSLLELIELTLTFSVLDRPDVQGVTFATQRVLKVPVFIGAGSFFKKLQVVFSRQKSIEFNLFFKKSKHVWKVITPINISIGELAMYLGREVFPSLNTKDYHWGLQTEHGKIQNYLSVESAGLNAKSLVRIYCTFKNLESVLPKETIEFIIKNDMARIIGGTNKKDRSGGDIIPQ